MSYLYSEPYAVVHEWILDAEISDRAVRLFAVLNRHANEKRGKAFPGRAALAERLRCSIKSVDRALEELESIRAITVKAHFRKDKSQTANSYWLWPRVDTGDEGGGVTGVPGGGQDGPPGETQESLLSSNESQRNESQKERKPEKRAQRQPRPHEVAARRIAQNVWERKTPKPAVPFPAVVATAEALLVAGHAPQTIEDTMVDLETISIRWCEARLNKGRANGNGSPAPRLASDKGFVARDAPEGVLRL